MTPTECVNPSGGSMEKVLLVGVGGFLGAISRFGVAQLLQNYVKHPFPIGTLIVNIVGCFSIGMLFEYLRGHQLLPTIALFVSVGFLGSFTTFSAFGFETVNLIKSGDFRFATINVGASLVLCLGAVIAGGWIGSILK